MQGTCTMNGAFTMQGNFATNGASAMKFEATTEACEQRASGVRLGADGLHEVEHKHCGRPGATPACPEPRCQRPKRSKRAAVVRHDGIAGRTAKRKCSNTTTA